MPSPNQSSDSVVPFCRRWHMIQEVDLARQLAGYDRRAGLCDELEARADALPDLPSAHQAAELCRTLVRSAEDAEREESAFFQRLFGRHDDRLTDILLNHVRLRQATQAAHVHELVSALDTDAGDHRPLPTDTLAYLLRCCFTSARQSIVFELLSILTLAERRLTRDARDMLLGRLAVARTCA